MLGKNKPGSPKDGHRLWLCHCQLCGTIRYVPSNKLLEGKSQNCGCIREAVFEEHRMQQTQDSKQEREVPADLLNKKIGLLTIVGPTGRDSSNHKTILCRCDCGNKKYIRETKLRTKSVNSCGCRKGRHSNDNMIGQKFGFLEVVGEAPKAPDGHRMWFCKCRCGKEGFAVRGDHLRKGATKSCGCRPRGYSEDENIENLPGEGEGEG